MRVISKYSLLLCMLLGVSGSAVYADQQIASATPEGTTVMGHIDYKDEELQVSVGGKSYTMLLRKPDKATQHPALLINLAGGRKLAMCEMPYRIVPDLFTAAGHYVVSLDLPYHGDLAGKRDGLSGIAAAMRDGEDVFGDFTAVGKAAIDACVNAGIAKPGRIVISGNSRGGFAAINLMAADRRISAGAVLAPVTYLPAVEEFKDLADSPMARKANALSLVSELTGRPLFIGMNTDDPRVGTDDCLRFHAALTAADPQARIMCLMTKLHGHGVPDSSYHAAGAFLLGVYSEGVCRDVSSEQ